MAMHVAKSLYAPTAFDHWFSQLATQVVSFGMHVVSTHPMRSGHPGVMEHA